MTHRTAWHRRPFIACTSLVLAACASTPVATGEHFLVLAADGRSMEQSAEHGDIAELAIATLAEELHVSVSDVTVDTVRVVNWPDSSIGCPLPGRSYLQVITPGHKISLRAQGAIHVVHEANGKAFVCRGNKVAPGGIDVTRELTWGEEAALARRDLAQRLNVEESQIRVMRVTAKTWPDASLGCAAPGMSPTPKETQGYVMRLRLGMRDYTYHVTKGRAVPCPGITRD